MSWPVYSAHLLDGALTTFGTSTASFTALAGFVTIIDTISADVDNNGFDEADLQCDAGSIIFWDPRIAPTRSRQLLWRGRVVLIAGTVVNVTINGVSSSAEFIMSGYQISLP